MPLFDFKCPRGHEFESFQKANHEGERVEPCPECGEIARRQWTRGAGFRMFREGFNICTGEYHSTQKDYEACKRRKGLVKVE
jgi:putative FmdB family regulatory protein